MFSGEGKREEQSCSIPGSARDGHVAIEKSDPLSHADHAEPAPSRCCGAVLRDIKSATVIFDPYFTHGRGLADYHRTFRGT